MTCEASSLLVAAASQFRCCRHIGSATQSSEKLEKLVISSKNQKRQSKTVRKQIVTSKKIKIL